MRKRTKAREYALQMLYQVDLRRSDAEAAIKEFWEEHLQSGEAEIKEFATQLVSGTVSQLATIDPLIETHASNWSLKRMGKVDRNVLRLGTYELLFMKETPPKVCINEAVDLAKRFGDVDSGKFINGILDAIHKRGS
jgi:N utilization substance protein B